MNTPEMANPTLDIALSSAGLAALLDQCQRVIAAKPDIARWLRHIPVASGLSLPFLPIRCFRLFNVSVFSDDELRTTEKQVFLSSGSTNETRAKHILGASGWASYARSSVDGYLDAARRLGIPESTPIVSLVPNRSRWPDSSLAAMVSFWQDHGLEVHYADVESDPSAPAKLFENSGPLAGRNSCVIFGTTLHHLTVAQWHDSQNAGKGFIPAGDVWFFDTGGTKGRTVSTSQGAIHSAMKSWLTEPRFVSYLSEYGMCELSSQAYSLQSVHDGSFRCAPSLRVLTARSDLQSVANPQEKGFLAFIDAANTDSWPFILTEDIGEQTDGTAMNFKLHGRAPDATVKGCSLNVRSNFRFDLSDNSRAVRGPRSDSAASVKTSDGAKNKPKKRGLFGPELLLEKLAHGEHWDGPAREDLAASLSGWNNPAAEKEILDDQKLLGKTIAVIASANVPVTWLFPAAVAWMSGAAAMHLYLPSVRQEDPLSSLIRSQIASLADAFNRCTDLNFINIHDNRMPSVCDSDLLLVFGNDTTVRTIGELASKTKGAAKVTGLGHFQNTIRIAADTDAADLAQTACRWFGRGCLTPLIAVVPETWTAAQRVDFAEKWVKQAASLMADKLKPAANPYQGFSHRHNLAEFESVCAAAGWTNVSVRSDTEAGVVCVNLHGIPASELENSELSRKLPEWGGCGWLTITSESDICSSWATLPCENPTPALWDPHQGKLWTEWLSYP